MKYVTGEIPQHPLRLGNSCNSKFKEDFEEIMLKEVIQMFIEKEVEKAENGYFSDNENPSRPKHNLIPPEKCCY